MAIEAEEAASEEVAVASAAVIEVASVVAVASAVAVDSEAIEAAASEVAVEVSTIQPKQQTKASLFLHKINL